MRSAGTVYAARIFRRSVVHGLDPRAAAAAFLVAGEGGLGPPVRHVDDVQNPSAIVLDFVEGDTPSEQLLGSEPALSQVAGLLAGIPALPWPAGLRLPDRSLRTTLGRYRRVLAGTTWAARAAARELQVEQALAAEQAGPNTWRPIHGDMHAGNLIWDRRRLWLIDWEYAGRADPLLDLASLAVNALPAAWTQLLVRYAGESEPARGTQADPAGSRLPGAEPQEPSPAQARRFAGLMLGAALRDLFWGYAQTLSGADLPCSDYVSINERRVERLAIWLTDPALSASGPGFG